MPIDRRETGPASGGGAPVPPAAIWQSQADVRLDRLDYAFQPIANVSTGHCFGYEALLRDCDQLGFASQRALFDACHAAGRLVPVQSELWARAVGKFAAAAAGQGTRLFLNLDSRSLADDEEVAHQLKAVLRHYGVPESAVVLELFEPPPEDGRADPFGWARTLRQIGCKLALDRCGNGVALARLLHGTSPDFIKVDRFLVDGIATDSRKRLLASQMITLAHLLGVVAVAVGVERETDFLTCKEIGCDLVQGRLIGDAVRDLGPLPAVFARVDALSRQDRRTKSSDRKIILDQMEAIPALPVDADVMAVFERLRDNPQQTFVPIVDQLGQPLGIVLESNIKNYAYSPYGKALIGNRGLGRKLQDFVIRCPIAEVQTSVENIISIYSDDDQAEGIILVDQMHYVGFLSARSIIRVINEKSLAMARDQNPLSKLPGNALINQYVGESLADFDVPYVYAYVDFDNFKPFNDKYGFRQGDRAILLFAELMRKSVSQDRPPGHFIGHIGGDDFFVGFKGFDLPQGVAEIASLIDAFRLDAESFYGAEERAAGCITAADRDGAVKCFPLLSASAAVVEVPVPRRTFTVDDVSRLIAGLKKQAKLAPGKIASARLDG